MSFTEDSRTKYISRIVRRHDRDLFARRNRQGQVLVLRRSKRMDLAYKNETQKIYLVQESPQYVFALTDNWNTTGRPIDWGGEVVLKRLKEHDTQANEALLEELEKADTKASEAKEKEFKTQTEDWLADNHSKFKRAFSDVRVSDMDRSEKRRKRFEKNQILKGN